MSDQVSVLSESGQAASGRGTQAAELVQPRVAYVLLAERSVTRLPATRILHNYD